MAVLAGNATPLILDHELGALVAGEFARTLNRVRLAIMKGIRAVSTIGLDCPTAV